MSKCCWPGMLSGFVPWIWRQQVFFFALFAWPLWSVVFRLVEKSMKRKTAARDRLLKAGWILLAVIIFVLVITIRIRLLAIPLERDEGEYAYAGQLMLQGVPPYKLAYNMKFPGTYAAYALIMAIFGQTIVGIHLGLLLVNTATILLVFLLGKRLINSVAGITAASTYALLAVSPSVLGLAAHAEHFVMLPVLAGTLLLLREGGTASQPPHLDRRLPKPSLFVCNSRIFVSGLLFGIGLLMKQPAVFFILFGALYLLSNDVRCKRGWKRALVRNLTFDLGAIVPFAIACLLLWRAGVFDKFWFWTINYARQYGTLVPFQVGAKLFSETASEVFSATWALWTLAALGVIGGFWDKRMRASAVFLVGLLAFSLAAFSAGFYFREHYYVFVLPAVSLFAGIAISTLSDLGINRASP